MPKLCNALCASTSYSIEWTSRCKLFDRYCWCGNPVRSCEFCQFPQSETRDTLPPTCSRRWWRAMRYLKRSRKRPSNGTRQCLFDYERPARSAHLVLLSTSSSSRTHFHISPFSTSHAGVQVRALDEAETTFRENVRSIYRVTLCLTSHKCVPGDHARTHHRCAP